MSEDKKSEKNEKDMEIEVLELEDFDEDDDFLSDEDEADLDISTLEDEDFSEIEEEALKEDALDEEYDSVFLEDDATDDTADEAVPLTAEKNTDFEEEFDEYEETTTKSSGGSGFGKFAASLVLLGGIGAGGYYAYNLPQVQEKFDLKAFVDMASATVENDLSQISVPTELETAQSDQTDYNIPMPSEEASALPPMPEIYSNEATAIEENQADTFEIAKTNMAEEELAMPVWDEQEVEEIVDSTPTIDEPLNQSEIYDPIFDDEQATITREIPGNLKDLNSNLAAPDFGNDPTVIKAEPVAPQVAVIEEVETPEPFIEEEVAIEQEAVEAEIEVADVAEEVLVEEPVIERVIETPEPEVSASIEPIEMEEAPVEENVVASIQTMPQEEEFVAEETLEVETTAEEIVEVEEEPVYEAPVQTVEVEMPKAVAPKAPVQEPASKPVARPAMENIIQASSQEDAKEYFEHAPSVSYGNVQGGLKRVSPSTEPASKFVVVKKSSEARGIESVLLAAKRAMKLHRYDAALEFYNDLYAKNKRDLRILVGRAVALQKSGRIDAAAQAYEEILRIDPDNTEVIVNMLGLIRESNPSTALQRLLNLKKKHPANPDLLAQIGVTHADLGNYREAIQALSMASSLEPRNPKHVYNMAVIAERMKDADSAVKYYEKALEVDAMYGDGSSLSREVVYKRLQKLRRM